MPPNKSTSALLESISAKSAKAKTAANAITDRIEQFEVLLSQLPGRIETVVHGTWPDPLTLDELHYVSLALWFHRQGNGWAISWARYDERMDGDPETPANWRPLTDASLKVKLAAIRMFPDLLDAIEKSQDTLIQELEEAASKYDEMAAEIIARSAAAKQKGAK